MLEKIKLAQYVNSHKPEIDEIMQKVFKIWNEIGKIAHDEETSNKMQIAWLVGMIKIWLSTSGMPVETQKEVLKKLEESL